MNTCQQCGWPFVTHPNGRADYCTRCLPNHPVKHPKPDFSNSPAVQAAVAAISRGLTGHDDDICRMAEEIEAWKDASGLLVGEDPDGVTPAMLAADLRKRDEELAAERKRREQAEIGLMAHEVEARGNAERAEEWKRRAEQAETARNEAIFELGQAREDLGMEHHLREQAERERDEARAGEAAAFVAGKAEARDDIERAEADNAALLDSLKAMARGAYTINDLVLARTRVAADHPGAARLERMRALETWVAKVSKRIESFAHAEACNVVDEHDPEEMDGCVCALALLKDVPETK